MDGESENIQKVEPITFATEKLGRPVSSQKTSFTKTLAVAGGLFSASLVTIGAIMLLSKGRPALSERVIKAVMESEPIVEHDIKLSAKELEKSVKVVGGAAAVTGAIGLLGSKAIWDSASSASRTRNYLKLSEALDFQGPSPSR